MKIVHVIAGLGRGGAELMLKRLVEGLNGKEGMQHSVISLTDLGPVGKELQATGIRVTSLGLKSVLSLPVTFFKLRFELKQQEPDIVQTWMYHADLLGGLAAKTLGVGNIIWGIRTTDISLGKSKVTIVLRKLCSWLSYFIPNVIVCAADSGRKIHEKVGYDPSKMHVIPNGFDLSKFNPSLQQRRELREKCGFTDEHIVIGSVGRFNLIKNQQDFVKAAALIATDYKNVRFMIVGRENTWENTELVGWIKQYSLQSQFVLLGERLDIPICLSAMDVFCLHSKTEGFPNVLGEAMAVGLPCVATNVGDAVKLLEAQYLCDVNAQAIASQFKFILNLENLKKIGADNKKRVSTFFSLEAVLEKFFKLYNIK